MAREMHRSVDEVGAVVAGAGIDCGFHKGGAIYFATNEGQLARIRMARGLATEVERLGGTIHEGTAVHSITGRIVWGGLSASATWAVASRRRRCTTSGSSGGCNEGSPTCSPRCPASL